ncbi:MAG: virulence RhuM family protein [Methanosarcinaceae archaeon]|nr:virulence RhuM family protein [Methanosarcinaceae archaeon]
MTDNLPEKSATSSQILLYQTEDGHNRIEVRLENETVWLSQGLMAELFQATKQNISLHIHNIFKEGELDKHSVVKEYLTTARDGKRYKTKYYNLDVIISVGYRVRSYRGTQFRQWATERLREYIVKGFTLDDERLQEPGGLDYFDELLERIRAIRASEKRFYQKIREIYATSIDYNSNHPMSREFFATVQNKLHYAITGHTAAELIAERSDATKPYMGLTNWKGSRRRRRFSKADVIVAKNYLNEEELSTLNLIVSQYLDFAELQARGRKPMYMADWKAKLDVFLTLNDQDILTDAGRASAQLAKDLAESEFEKYQARQHQIEADTANEELNRTVKRILQNERKKS